MKDDVLFVFGIWSEPNAKPVIGAALTENPLPLQGRGASNSYVFDIAEVAENHHVSSVLAYIKSSALVQRHEDWTGHTMPLFGQQPSQVEPTRRHQMDAVPEEVCNQDVVEPVTANRRRKLHRAGIRTIFHHFRIGLGGTVQESAVGVEEVWAPEVAGHDDDFVLGIDSDGADVWNHWTAFRPLQRECRQSLAIGFAASVDAGLAGRSHQNVVADGHRHATAVSPKDARPLGQEAAGAPELGYPTADVGNQDVSAVYGDNVYRKMTGRHRVTMYGSTMTIAEQNLSLVGKRSRFA